MSLSSGHTSRSDLASRIWYLIFGSCISSPGSIRYRVKPYPYIRLFPTLTPNSRVVSQIVSHYFFFNSSEWSFWVMGNGQGTDEIYSVVLFVNRCRPIHLDSVFWSGVPFLMLRFHIYGYYWRRFLLPELIFYGYYWSPAAWTNPHIRYIFDLNERIHMNSDDILCFERRHGYFNVPERVRRRRRVLRIDKRFKINYTYSSERFGTCHVVRLS